MMKNKIRSVGFLMTIILLALSLNIPYVYADDKDDSASENSTDEVYYINDMTDFNEFVSYCSEDGWSLNKEISLETDIIIPDADFGGIPYFNGTFEGNGHTITVNYMSHAGSNYGLFRYVGAGGIVQNLIVNTVCIPTGSAQNVGGIAGVNYGTIKGCYVSGKVKASVNVGGIAGINKETGVIMGCTSACTVLGTDETGGIAGTNNGTVIGCSNSGNINDDEQATATDISDVVDVNGFNLVSEVTTRNDMAGICGYSDGMISSCSNTGNVGYAHTGYNVGGIAGRQSGVVMTCLNYGEILGRKDVGGIVGQAEPFIEEDFLSSHINSARESVNDINDTLSSIVSTAERTSDETGGYAENLYNKYKDEKETVSANIATIKDMGPSSEELQEYYDNIEASQKKIDELEKQAKDIAEHPEKLLESDYDGPTYSEIMKSIKDEYDKISENMTKIQNSVTKEDIETVEDMKDHYAELLADDSDDKDIDGMIESMKTGYDEIRDLMGQANDQIEELVDETDNTISLILDSDKIEDVTSLENTKDLKGVIIGCTNRGKVEGDINTGGVAGTMNIEFNEDPEYDFDLTEETDVVLRTKVSCIVSKSTNYGVVVSKKNYSGGVVGQQEFGIVTECEGYGRIESESGSYLGGVVGYSAGTIMQSYCLCNISGTDFAGGICGYGYTVKDCISMATIDAGGECVGAIAGDVDDEGERVNNFFSSDDLEGIDYITYVGIAEKMDKEELLKREDIPEGFNTVTVRFNADDEEIGSITVPFGGYITEEDFPEAPIKEGYYAVWDTDDINEPVVDNRVYDVEYIRWVDSVSGMEYTDTGLAVFLVEGSFYKETGVILEMPEKVYVPEAGDSLLYAYKWNLKNVAVTSPVYTVRVYVGEEAERGTVYILSGDTFTEAKCALDGRYLVLEMRPGDTFAVVRNKPDHTEEMIKYGCIGGAVLLIIIFITIKNIKKKKLNKEFDVKE